MFGKKSVLFVFCISLVFVAASQQVSFINYTMYDGLVANPIRCIYQDSKGFLWIGTYDGLSRYDGYRFTNYTSSNGLSHNFINSIIEVNDKLLVAENNGAVDVIQNNVIKKTFTAQSAVNIILPYRDRLLFPSDANGFYEYKEDSFFLANQQKTNSTLGHFLPINDSLFITSGVDHSLILYKKDLTIQSSLDYPGLHFYSLFADSKKRFWACTSYGLKLIEVVPNKQPSVKFAPLPLPFNAEPLQDAHVTWMIEERDGSFWIGTTKGLMHLAPDGTYHIYNEKDGLPSATIHTLYYDKEHNLWIGTAMGLAKWGAKNNVFFYNNENKDFKNDINSIYPLNEKNILVRTDHGLQYFNVSKKEFKDIGTNKKNEYTPITGTSPLLIHYDLNKIGTIDSLKNTIVPVKILDTTIPAANFASIHPNGTIFFGSFNGVFALKDKTVKRILTYRVTSLIVDKAGTIWAGTWTNGLFRITIKEDTRQIYELQDMTPVIKETFIRGLYTDSRNNIWIATRYKGAYCLTQKPGARYDLQHFDRRSGLISDWVTTFCETSNGDIWVGTFLGIDKLVKEPTGFRIFNFSKAVNFFAEVRNILPVDHDNLICVANTGIAAFKDEKIHETSPLPVVILSTSLGVKENKVTIFSPSERIILKPNQNAARFEFSALGFVNERQVMYSYRLKGSGDTTWTRPANIHEATYASLAPGDYTFEVKSIGWNGKDGNAATFSFHIKTPFWKQWWFIGFCFILVMMFFYALYRYRIRQLLRLQTVRNSIATDLHDDIGSSLTNISILSELSNKNILEPSKAQKFLERISEEVQTSSQAMDDIIWSVNSHNDSLQETMARMRRYAAQMFDNSEIDCHLHLDENTGNKRLSMEQRRDVYLIYKETLNNIHKHADAKNVWIEVDQNENHLWMQVKDDGKGFNPKVNTHRNGLKNLRSRAEKWSGKIKIQSEENKGTTIEIMIPLKD